MGLNKLSVNSASLILNVGSSIERVHNHVSNNFDSFFQILLLGCHHIAGIFPRGVGVEISSHVFDLQLKLLSSSVLGAFEV